MVLQPKTSVAAFIALFFSIALLGSSTAFSATKNEAVLKKVNSATSLQEISRAIQNAQLSKAELKKMERELNSAQYKKKIERLISKAKMKNETLTQTPQAAVHRQSSGQATPVKTARRPIPKTPDKVIKAKLMKARQNKLKAQRSLPRASTMVKKTDLAMMRGRLATTGPVASISGLAPRSGGSGATVTITGTDFGPQGRVAIIVGEPNVGRGQLLFADITRWTNSRITVNLPRALQSAVGEHEKSGLIWVKLAGGETGPYKEFTFKPNLEALTPVISEVTPNPISPDSNILIIGEHFLTSSKPTVKALTSGGEVELNVTEWGDEYIYVTSEKDYHGTLNRISDGGFNLLVRNHLGQEVRKAVTMARRMERRTIHHGHSHRVQCEVWNSSKDRPSAFCLAGKKKTFSFPYSRCAGWNVIDYTIHIEDRGCCSGYSFKKEPFGNDPSYEVELWANAYGYIQLQVDVELEGPEGTSCW